MAKTTKFHHELAVMLKLFIEKGCSLYHLDDYGIHFIHLIAVGALLITAHLLDPVLMKSIFPDMSFGKNNFIRVVKVNAIMH